MLERTFINLLSFSPGMSISDIYYKSQIYEKIFGTYVVDKLLLTLASK